MKRILALINSFQTDNLKLYHLVLEQLKCYSLKGKYTLVHLVRKEELDKNFIIYTEKINPNLTVVTLEYCQKTPSSFREKFKATSTLNQLVRMVAQAIMEEQEIDQVHIHESWPLIMLGRELSNVRKKPIFLFEYDKDYMYLSYRKRNNLSMLPYLVVLFSAISIQKVFAHSPKLINKVSKNLNIKRKAAIIPLGVDTEIFYIKKNQNERNNLFLYYPEHSDYVLSDVLNVLKSILHHHPSYQAHVLIDNPKDYKSITTLYKQNDIHFYNHLEKSQLSDLLRETKATIILDDDVQQMLLMSEALCCGSIIVAMATVAVADELDEQNSCTFANRDNNELKKSIEDAINSSLKPKDIAKNASAKYNYPQVSQILYREIRNY